MVPPEFAVPNLTSHGLIVRVNGRSRRGLFRRATYREWKSALSLSPRTIRRLSENDERGVAPSESLHINASVVQMETAVKRRKIASERLHGKFRPLVNAINLYIADAVFHIHYRLRGFTDPFFIGSKGLDRPHSGAFIDARGACRIL